MEDNSLNFYLFVKFQSFKRQKKQTTMNVACVKKFHFGKKNIYNKKSLIILTISLNVSKNNLKICHILVLVTEVIFFDKCLFIVTVIGWNKEKFQN